MIVSEAGLTLLREQLEPERTRRMTRNSSAASEQHLLYLPTGLRIGRMQTGYRDEEFEGLVWDSWEPTWIPLDQEHECLWDFVKLAGTARWEELPGSVPMPNRELPRSVLRWDPVPEEELMAFMAKWGLLGYEESIADNDYRVYPPPDGARDAANIEEWTWRATLARALLEMFALTEAGEAASDELVLAISENVETLWPSLEDEREQHEYRVEMRYSLYRPDGTLRSFEEGRLVGRAVNHHRILALLVQLRREGNGIAYQQQCVADGLGSFLQGWTQVPVWDKRGRRFDRETSGVVELVGTELSELFLRSDPQLGRCSVCQRPYPLALDDGQRRPRSGFRRYCSEACRAEGKRESNRRAWQRNKSRWRGKGELSLHNGHST